VLNVLNIGVKCHIKVLELIFDKKFSWYPQAMTVIEKAIKIKQGLQLVGKYFTKEKIVENSASLFYSRLYYGAKVWLYAGLSAISLQKGVMALMIEYR